MTEPTVGAFAKWLETNPGWHPIGDGMIAKHVGTIDMKDWINEDGSVNEHP